MVGGVTVTATVGVMNRQESLLRSLPTWLALSQLDRVVVVDWGSAVPLYSVLGDFLGDPRLVVARVEERFWCNSKCHNLELQLAGDWGLWLRLDSDVLVRPDFLELHPARPGSFYAGDWRVVPVEVDDKRNLSGVLLVEPRYVSAVNGYDERLVWYGREDDDLYSRLVGSGLCWDKLVLESLEHVTHSDVCRYENLAVAPHVHKLVGSYGARNYTPGGPARHEVKVLLSMSEQERRSRPWTSADRRTRWGVRRLADNYLECTRT